MSDPKQVRSLNIYLALMAISIFLSWVGYSKNEFRYKTIREENLVNIIIDKISCGGGRNYIVFKHEGKIHLANIHYQICIGLRVGQRVKAYYNKNSDLFLVKDDGLGEDYNPLMWTGAFAAIAFLGCYFYSYRKIKRYNEGLRSIPK